MRAAHLALTVLVLLAVQESLEAKSLDGSMTIRSVKKRVGERFKDWKDEDEYVDHDFYKRKRTRDRDLERERQRQRDRERELDRERERLKQRDRERERELQRERDHKELLEKLLTTTKNTPIAAIAPVGPLSFPMAHSPLPMPAPQPPPPPPPPTPAPAPPSQIQAPPTQGNDLSMGSALTTPPLPPFGSMGSTTASDWYSDGASGLGGAPGELYSATNLGGGVYDDFGSGPSSLMAGGDWRELAHWYREQNWDLEDWSPGGGGFGGGGGQGKHFKKHGKHKKGHKISGVKGGILKAKITALFVKKIGIAFLIALLAPLVVITVFGPFLTALSLLPLNFQLYGGPGVPPGQRQQQQQQQLLLLQDPKLHRLQQPPSPLKSPFNSTVSDDTINVNVRKRREASEDFATEGEQRGLLRSEGRFEGWSPGGRTSPTSTQNDSPGETRSSQGKSLSAPN